MGNTSSQEEANGTALGGFLGLLGSVVVSVICPPVAVIVIPAGFATHTYGMATIVKYDNKPPELKKQGSTGDFVGGIIRGATLGGTFQAGVNYKDNDSNPHLHYCPSNVNPIEMRERQEEKIKLEQSKMKDKIKQDKINLNTYLADNFHKATNTSEYIKSYWYYHYYYQADANFNSYKLTDLSKLITTHTKYCSKLSKYNSSLYCKSIYTYLSISKLPKLIEKWKTHQNIHIKNTAKHLVKAVVYGLNAIEIGTVFASESSSMQYAMYCNQIDESMKNYCCHMKDAILEMVKSVKDSYTTGRKIAIMENTINSMYDEVSKYNASKKQICAKYGTYIDSNKYKLDIKQKAEKIEEFLNKDFNTTEYHKNIHDIIKKTVELFN